MIPACLLIEGRYDEGSDKAGRTDIDPDGPRTLEPMGRQCAVCVHPKRDDINRRLLKVADTGEPLAAIGEAYGLTSSAVGRHKLNHLKLSTSLVSEAKNALTVVGYAHELYERAGRIADRAEEMLAAVQPGDMPSRSVQAAAASLRELRGAIELLAKLVVSTAPEVEDAGNSWLDAELMRAVEGLAMAELPAGTADIAVAQIIDAPD